MKTYKILTKNKHYKLKTSRSLSYIETSPALFFLTDGEFKIKKCGRLNIVEKLTSHLKILMNSLRLNNA